MPSVTRRKARRPVRLPLLPLAAAVSMVIAACGSTVQMRTSLPGEGSMASGGHLNDGSPVTDGGRATGPGAGTGQPDAAGGAAGPATTGGPQQELPTADPHAGPVLGKGGSIEIGYSTERDSSTATASFGFTGVSTGDMDAQMAAIAAYVNSKGGLLGHKIVLVNYDAQTVQSANNSSQTTQEACVKWTQDHHVFAAVDVINLSYNSTGLAKCLGDHGALLLSDGDTDGTAASYALPYGPFSANNISTDRYVPALVDRLVAQHFFDGWNADLGVPGPAPLKIGLMHYDDPGGNAYARTLKKALAQHGMAVAVEETYADGVQSGAAGGSAAALKFRDAHVTHVFNANIGFYHTASSQQYYPRAEVDDLVNTPATLASQPGMAKSLHGAMGAGVAPAIEIQSAPDTTSAATLCKQIMRNAGLDYSNGYTLAIMLSECSAMFLLMSATDRGGVLSAAGFRSGIVALGNTFKPTLTYRSRFSATKHDGASAIRDFVYQDTCTCFVFPSTTLYPA